MTAGVAQHLSLHDSQPLMSACKQAHLRRPHWLMSSLGYCWRREMAISRTAPAHGLTHWQVMAQLI